MNRPPTMTVLVNGEECEREVKYVDCSDDLIGVRRIDRRVPHIRDDETMYETLDGPPIIVRTGVR